MGKSAEVATMQPDGDETSKEGDFKGPTQSK